MNCIEIDGRKIGKGYKPLVIAEIGINHNGSLEVAKQMVDSAKRVGVELIKHQTHIIEDEMSKEAKKVVPGNTNISIYDVMKQAALSETDEIKLKEYVEENNMIFLSTPFSRAAADRLERMGVSAYKIGSGECNNYPLIEYVAKFGKPMIISTGMNDINSIKKTVSIVEKYKTPYALLHTTNLYPTSPKQVRLLCLKEMEEAFPNAVIGLSDHSLNNNACIGAMALGASIVERHYTDTKCRNGPDIICSANEKEMYDLIQASKEIFEMLRGNKRALPEEQVTIDFAFSTIVTIKQIKKGDIFSTENIWVKRPGNKGILAEHYYSVLGKIAREDINQDEHIEWEMVT
ncbi:MAG: N-acetylneuraminate synthase family protein [Sphaerochaetaceae bacterium]|nr:N-acetylneuraminate synthase family protein [Sphaerochaetaceae bacterium]